MTKTLEKYLEERFRDNPAAAGGFADRSLKIVSVHRRQWRGQKIASRAEVTVESRDVRAAVTDPRWNMLPLEMKRRFEALTGSVNAVLDLYSVGGRRSDEEIEDSDAAEALGALLRGGLYLVETANMPRVVEHLTGLQREWMAAADSYTTEDGYRELRDAIRQRVGDDVYALLSNQIPDRESLARKYGLKWYELPVRFVPDAASSAAQRTGAVNLAVGAVAAVVRKPRERLAHAAASLANACLDADGNPVRERKTAKGKVGRMVRGQLVTAVRAAVAEFHKAVPIDRVDGALSQSIGAAVIEFPDAADAATELAKKCNADDGVARRVGGVARDLERSALDEAGMIESLAGKL